MRQSMRWQLGLMMLALLAGGIASGCSSEEEAVGTVVARDREDAALADADAAVAAPASPVAAPSLRTVELLGGTGQLNRQNTSVVIRSQASPAAAGTAWEARLGEVTGQLQIDGQELKALNVEIDTTAIQAADADMRQRLGSADFLNTTEFPTARFEVTRVEPSGKAEGARRVVHVTGNLTLAGQTQEITAPAVILVQDDQVAISISMQLDRDAFGMAPYQEDVQNTFRMAIEIGPQDTLL